MSVLFPLATRRDAKIAINPLTWLAVGPTLVDDVCGIVISREVVIEVVGSVADVVAALEAAGVPAVAPVVEVAPTDLERAADVLEELARAARTGSFDESKPCVSVIDRAVGVGSYEWDDTADALIGLAARLRGAR
jgi:hypothetical protein